MNLLRLKRLFAGCLLAVSTLPAWGQSAPTLAIRIDDLGAFHSVNEACIQTYQSGIARSVEVMPVAAWYPEAVRLLKENPGLDADRKSTRLNSSHRCTSRMPSSA